MAVLWKFAVLRVFFVCGAFAWNAWAQTWVQQTSGTDASLRGISVVNAKIAWASGAGGIWLRTLDGGTTWTSGHVAGAEALAFRGIRAWSASHAMVMSSGPGEKSRVYQTQDGGVHWRLLFTNPDAGGFFDAIAFWTPRHGILAGDPVKGHIAIFLTSDGGEHWISAATPLALAKEGAFAASNSCLAIRGKAEAWFATGGEGGGRVFHSTNGGAGWSVAMTPVRHDSPSAGIFSLAFGDGIGVAVGGDYAHDKEAAGNIAIARNGSAAWLLSEHGPAGFRSAVVYLKDRKLWMAGGTSGSDISIDKAKSWVHFDDRAINAIGGLTSDAVWGVGPKGAIAMLRVR